MKTMSIIVTNLIFIVFVLLLIGCPTPNDNTSEDTSEEVQSIKIQLMEYTLHDPDDGWTTTSGIIPIHDTEMEIDRLNLFVDAFNKESTVAAYVQFVDETPVFDYITSGWTSMGEGDTYPPDIPPAIYLEFDVESYDFNLAKLYFHGEARDWDSALSDPEVAIGSETYIGEEMIGYHTINLYHDDFNFDVRIVISKENL